MSGKVWLVKGKTLVRFASRGTSASKVFDVTEGTEPFPFRLVESFPGNFRL
jgi:hypothetical protein